MTKRLELNLPDDEHAALEIAASAAGKSVEAWVRRVLRDACSKDKGGTASNLAAERKKETTVFAADDIKRMLADDDYAPDPPKSS